MKWRDGVPRKKTAISMFVVSGAFGVYLIIAYTLGNMEIRGNAINYTQEDMVNFLTILAVIIAIVLYFLVGGFFLLRKKNVI
jgi:cytochrome bd-type quinol oxidase subunit 2